jgi:hypothetical protein
VPYEWEDWAQRALAGIEPYEVRQALDAARRWPRPATGPHGLRILTIWSRTLAGRPLVVAILQVTDATWRIIGARDLSEKELIEFTDWEDAR